VTYRGRPLVRLTSATPPAASPPRTPPPDCH
jgi:hypothetical protein